MLPLWITKQVPNENLQKKFKDYKFEAKKSFLFLSFIFPIINK